MEDSYFATTPFGEQQAHAHLARDAEKTGAAALAHFHEDRNALELTVAAKDRPGLFADIADRLSRLGAQVVGARLFTSQRGLALDVFYLHDATGAPWGRHHPAELGRLRREIEAAAAEGAPRPRPEPEKPWRTQAASDLTPTVVVDNEATDAATIVEVSGRDRPGLLASLARRLAAAGLSVQSAHIENYGLRAVDAFYVLTEGGEKVTGLQGHTKRSRLNSGVACAYAVARHRLAPVVTSNPAPRRRHPRCARAWIDVRQVLARGLRSRIAAPEVFFTLCRRRAEDRVLPALRDRCWIGAGRCCSAAVMLSTLSLSLALSRMASTRGDRPSPRHRSDPSTRRPSRGR